MKTVYFAVVLSLTCLLDLGGSAYAARNNAHSVEISDAVQIGGTKLKPGNYKVEWQGTGPAVQVSFQQNGKTVVTVPGMLKTNDDQVIQDAIVTDKGMLRTKCGSWHRLRIEVHYETCDS